MKTLINFVCRNVSATLGALTLTLLFACATTAQTTAFTYQGRFTDSSVTQPTNGTYTMTFRLYDAATGGNQIGSPVTTSVTVVNGIFSAPLDFGAAAFNTTGARYLEIQIGSTVLAPRQPINAAPFAARSVNAATADALSANCVGCVTDAKIASGISYSKLTGAPTSLPPTGAAGGDLTGTYPNPTIAANAVTSAKILDGTIANADISTTAAIDGTKIVGNTITNLNASNLGTGTVPVARIGTNAPTATTFLRGDNTWQAIGGGVGLQLVATSTSGQVVGAGTSTVNFNNTVTAPPTGSSFVSNTFTAGSAGLYMINVSMAGTGQGVLMSPVFVVNGTIVGYGAGAASSNFPNSVVTRANGAMTVSLAAGGTIVIKVDTGAIANTTTLTTDGTTRLMITKLN